MFVHCTFEDWMWNYSNIKVYFKTLMLGGINREKNGWLISWVFLSIDSTNIY